MLPCVFFAFPINCAALIWTKNLMNLVKFIQQALEDLKAENIVCLDVSKLTGMTDHLFIATGNSTTHTRAIANHLMREAKKNHFTILGHEGDDTAEWILVDFADAVVNIMLPKIREYYELEKLWR